MNIPSKNINLIHQTRPYAVENVNQSVWVVLSTFGLLVALISLSLLVQPIILKIILSVFIGLLVMRCFILFHDFHHKAILAKSFWAKILFEIYGLFIFTPSNVWRQSHNFHHSHNTIMDTSHIGSFWTVSVDRWLSMSKLEQFKYHVVRNPLTIFFGVISVFIYDHALHTLIRNPLKNFMSLFAIALNMSVLLLAIHFQVITEYVYAYLIPWSFAGCIGAYLFYAQHNFPNVKLFNRSDWNYTNAALKSSSFIKMSPVMNWFSGNIAYHHVHHINHKIPFYRLPEAMAGIKELQAPTTTTLSVKDIVACLSIKLWDEDKGQMIGFNELPDRNQAYVETHR